MSKAQAQENPTAKPSPKAIPLTRSRAKDRLKVPQLDGGDDTNTKTNKKVNLRKLADRNAKSKAVEVSSQKQSSAKDFDETSNSDSDFAPTSAKRVKRPGIQSNSPNKKANRGHLYQNCKRSRAVFSDNERSPARLSAPAPKDSVDHWVEVFCEDEGKWVAVNLFKPSVNNIDSVKVRVFFLFKQKQLFFKPRLSITIHLFFFFRKLQPNQLLMCLHGTMTTLFVM